MAPFKGAHCSNSKLGTGPSGIPSLCQEGRQREGDEHGGGGGEAHEDGGGLQRKGKVDQGAQRSALQERKCSEARDALALMAGAGAICR